MRISDWSSDVCSSDLLGLGKDAQLPLKKQTEKDEKGKKVPTGKLVFRTKSQYAPVIADVTGKPIPEKQLKSLKIGAGSEVLIQGYFSDYVMTVRSEAHTFELQSLMRISYAVFCLTKKKMTI